MTATTGRRSALRTHFQKRVVLPASKSLRTDSANSLRRLQRTLELQSANLMRCLDGPADEWLRITRAAPIVGDSHLLARANCGSEQRVDNLFPHLVVR